MEKATQGMEEYRIRCVAYGRLAQETYAFLQAGSQVAVSGHLQVRPLPGSAKPRWVTEVVAERIVFVSNINYELGQQVLAPTA